MREFYFSSLVSPEFFTFHISFSVYLFPLRFHYRGERKSINTFPSLPGNLLIRIIQFIRCIFFFFFPMLPRATALLNFLPLQSQIFLPATNSFLFEGPQASLRVLRLPLTLPLRSFLLLHPQNTQWRMKGVGPDHAGPYRPL